MTNNFFLVSIHSDRSFYEKTLDLQYLQKRFLKKKKIKNLSFERSVPYKGKICFWNYKSKNSIKLEYLYSPGFKVQYICQILNKIVILGADRIQIIDNGQVRNVFNNLFFGCHIVCPDQNQSKIVWISSAVTNRLIKFNTKTLKIEKTIIMPKKFGNEFLNNINFKKNYISTDNQNTHLNSVLSHKNRLYVTFWKQGLLGYYENGKFNEVLSGFIGLHSVRIFKNLLYFTDSSASSLVIIDSSSHKIINRIKFDTKYVHDAYLLDDNKLFYSSEKNKIILYDYKKHEVLNTLDTTFLEGSVQFLNILKNSKNLNFFKKFKFNSFVKKIVLKYSNNFDNFDLFNLRYYNKNSYIFHFENVKYQYLMKPIKTLKLIPGKYSANIKFKKYLGDISFDILDTASQEFIKCENFTENDSINLNFQINEEKELAIIISGNNIKINDVLIKLFEINIEKWI